MLNDAALQYQLKDALLSAHENGHLQASNNAGVISQDVEGRNLPAVKTLPGFHRYDFWHVLHGCPVLIWLIEPSSSSVFSVAISLNS